MVCRDLPEQTVRRFFLPEVPNARTAFLDGDQAHHLHRVLRMQPGDSLIVTDPNGCVYAAVIDSMEPGRATLSLVGQIEAATELPVQVTVYQALIKGDHFNMAVQKCVETGAMQIVPFLSQRCVKRPKNPQQFVERSQRIALEAAKQCGRTLVPRIGPIVDLETVADRIEGQCSVLAYEREKAVTLRSILEHGCPETMNLVVGPEGGFTPEEADRLARAGARPVSLGPRILRSETAAPYMLAQVNYACDG